MIYIKQLKYYANLLVEFLKMKTILIFQKKKLANKLDDKIRKLIYNELMRTYNDKKYHKMKEYIFKIKK